MKRIVILTGAGVSAESGIPTFRDAGTGLWENYSVDDVCVKGCLKKNPEVVHEFYNMLRKKYGQCKLNAAHYTIAELEKDYEVTVVTQNVDDLHKQAGSTHVIHLHGELMKCRDTGNTNYIYPIPQDENGEFVDDENVWVSASDKSDALAQVKAEYPRASSYTLIRTE